MRHIAERFPDGRVTGQFTLGPGTTVFGDLKLKGAQTSLDLRNDTFFSTHDIPGDCITGTLHDLTKVTLIGCFVSSHGTASRRGQGYERATVLPRFAVFGDAHVSPTEPVIKSLSFVIDDADVLFHDYDAFGSVIDARPLIEQIVRANKDESEIAIGPYPQIQYFTGKSEIISAQTCLGRVTANHNPSWSIGGPAGVRMDNTITVKLVLDEPATFTDAISHVFPLLRFMQLMIGRPQNLLEMWVQLPDLEEDIPNYLDVYWSTPPHRENAHESQRTHQIDVLLSPVRDTEAFASVLGKWLEHDKPRQDARNRFADTFGLQRSYPMDRIIAAANMFDILPEDAAPAAAEIAPETLEAKRQCRAIFAALPPSLEREYMLNALGRIGKSNLKHRVRHRAKPIIAALGRYFPHLVIAINEAVNCRDYFVHGGPSSFDYSNNFGTVVFLTDTLEFVFGASDLIDAGWDIKSWGRHGSPLSHPFARYRHNYELNIRELRKLLQKT